MVGCGGGGGGAQVGSHFPAPPEIVPHADDAVLDKKTVAAGPPGATGAHVAVAPAAGVGAGAGGHDDDDDNPSIA
jgi:hypothetical protein